MTKFSRNSLTSLMARANRSCIVFGMASLKFKQCFKFSKPKALETCCVSLARVYTWEEKSFKLMLFVRLQFVSASRRLYMCCKLWNVVLNLVTPLNECRRFCHHHPLLRLLLWVSSTRRLLMFLRLITNIVFWNWPAGQVGLPPFWNCFLKRCGWLLMITKKIPVEQRPDLHCSNGEEEVSVNWKNSPGFLWPTLIVNAMEVMWWPRFFHFLEHGGFTATS